MRTRLFGLALLLGGCLDQRPYGAAGHLCETDADCDAQTWCVRTVCEVRPPASLKPDATNTGVPRDVTLTQSATLRITQDGTVIDGKDIRGCVDVQANDVTIRRSRISCGSYFVIRIEPPYRNLLVEDVEVDGDGFSDSTGVAFVNFTLRRSNLHGLRKGAATGENVRVESSYIHDPISSKPCGVCSNGSDNLVITGNNIDFGGLAGAPVDFDTALGSLEHILVERNWLNGGQHTARMGGSDVVDVKLLSNRFGRDHRESALQLTGDVSWADNVFEDTGEPVEP